MDFFLIKIIIAGVGLSLSASSIGCFILWKKIAYFGDSLAHSILLGILIGICYNLSPIIGSLLFSILIALILNFFDTQYSKDSILGIVSQSCLALSVVLSSYFKSNLNLDQYLFGDILTINEIDIISIYILLSIVLIWLKYRFDSLILITISKELAYSNNIKVKRIELELVLFIAIIVAFAIKIVGALLINALLIMPPAIAKTFSNSPKQMLLYSLGVSSASTIGGILISNYSDLPTGPTIILVNLILLITMNLLKLVKQH